MITLEDFKKDGKLRKYITKVGMLGKIDDPNYDQNSLLRELISSITNVGVMEDSNMDGILTEEDNIATILPSIEEVFKQTPTTTIHFGGTYYLEGETKKYDFTGVNAKLAEYLNGQGFDDNKLYSNQECTAEVDFGTAKRTGSLFMEKVNSSWSIVDLYGKKTTANTDENGEPLEPTVETITVDKSAVENIISGIIPEWKSMEFFIDSMK